jgi:serine/threonine protein kinase
MDRDRTGRKIDNYVLIKKIGQGMFSEVYLGRNELDGKEYAVKCLDKKVIALKTENRVK